jgi:hypothetical protein
MNREGVAQKMDELLEPFLNAPSGPDSDRLLADLLSEHADAIICGIIRVKLHAFGAADNRTQGQDAQDIHSDVVAQLIVRLSALKSSPGSDAILDFRSYVAAATFNAYYQYLRRRYPLRWRLKNRVRYLLTHRQELAIWEVEGGDYACGLATWRERGMSSLAGNRQLRELLDDPGQFERAWEGKQSIQRAGLDQIVETIFEWIEAPVELDLLVTTVAEIQGIADRPEAPATVDDGDTAPEEQLADPRESVADEIEKRSCLKRLWSEITELPLKQRIALLLNLRDLQEGVIALLPVTGVATFRQIAEAVAMSAEEFAGLWNDLPLEDAAIAERLGMTRQQVINLRKSARARLARRIKVFEAAR